MLRCGVKLFAQAKPVVAAAPKEAVKPKQEEVKQFVKPTKDVPNRIILGKFEPKISVHGQMAAHYKESRILSAFSGLTYQPDVTKSWFLKKAQSLSEWGYLLDAKISTKGAKFSATEIETLLTVYPDFFETLEKLRSGEIMLKENSLEKYLQLNPIAYNKIVEQRSIAVLDWALQNANLIKTVQKMAPADKTQKLTSSSD